MIIILLLVAYIHARNHYEGYALPLMYGPWFNNTEGVAPAGNTCVGISVEPKEGVETLLFCQIDCCNEIAEFYDGIVCRWPCMGSPHIRCKGSPFGGPYDIFMEIFTKSPQCPEN